VARTFPAQSSFGHSAQLAIYERVKPFQRRPPAVAGVSEEARYLAFRHVHGP
jgi:hypothetical protein